MFNSVAKNLANLGLKFTAVGLDFYTIFWLNSNLSAEVYKNYNLTIAYIPIVISIIDFGIENLIQKYFTRHENDTEYLADIWTTFNVLRFLTYFVGLIIIIFTYRIFDLENLLIIILLFSSKFVMIWDENYRGVSMANDKTWRFSLVDLATKVLFISGLLATIFVPEFRTIYYYATLSIITYSLGFVIDYFTFKKSVTVGRFRLPLLRAILPVMGYLGLTMLLKSVYLTTDSFVLAWTGAEDGVINGYTESYKLMEVFMIAPALVMPSIASKWKKSQRVQDATKVKQDFFRTLMLSLVLGVILYLVIIILGPLALGVIQLNNTYASAFVALPILGVSLIVFFAQTYLRHVLVLENLEKSELLANLITAILSICIYALIIPRFGFIGASWSTVAVFFVLTLLRLGFAIRHLRVLD